MPAPEPPLKIVPSSTYQLRIESILSSTDRMKQALACWGTPGTPMLNHTGRVERRPLGDEEVLELVAEGLGLVVVDEVAALDAPLGDGVDHPVDDLLERLTRARGAGVPRKYFWATMLVALSDHVVGNSTPSCSKATDPSGSW
jgi:hypothetical protein